jgi:membrane peptidoglycan carboxypeptidase
VAAGSSASAGATTVPPASGSRHPRPTGWRRVFNYPRSHVRSFRRWLPSWRVVVGAILGVFALGTGLVVAAYATTKIPTAAPYLKYQTTTVYYSDGKTVIGTIKNNDVQNHKLVKLDDLPKYVGDAVVASEDQSFYKNAGVDPKGIARALVTNLKTGSRTGGSTITQQYAERYFHEGSTEDYVGKFKEALLAIKLSKSQEKTEILGNYLNTIYWGRNADGIEAASEAYFGQPAAKLTVSQSAMLAGIIPAPSSWDPRNDKASAELRWKRCLDLMLTNGYITQAQHDAAIKHGLPSTIKPKASQAYTGQSGYLIDMVKAELGKQADMTDDDINTRGMNIVTTIDKPMEDAAVAQIKTTPSDASKRLGTGLASIDPADGSIKAIYGGPDFVKSAYNASASGFNGIKAATAQGGSTFKAFALAAALEQGYSLDQTFDGSAGQIIPGYQAKPVANADGDGHPNETLREGFSDSVNAVFAHVNVGIGPAKTAEMAERLGIGAKIGHNAANVLGTDSVSALQLASAYSTIAAEGEKSTPHIVKSARTLDGKLVYQGPTKRKRVLDSEVADGVISAMQDVVTKGTGHRLPNTWENPDQVLGRPAAGKTGTTNDYKSAWFAGFTPQLVTVVGNWQSTKKGGNDSITPFGYWRGSAIAGGTWPVDLWTNYMKDATEGMPVEQFPTYTPTRATWSPTPTYTPAPTPTQTSKPTQETTQEPTQEPTQKPATSTVPGGIVGQNVAAARQALQNAGYKVVVTKVPDANVAPDVVISVQPGEGATVKPGQVVSVVVSSGPPVAKPTQTTPPEPQPTQTAPVTQPTGGGGKGSGGSGGGQTGRNKAGDQ